MKFKLQPYSIHELGQRQNQEDSLFPLYGESTKDDRLFILCDGMGGHEKGEVASATVCEAMSNCILSRWNSDEPLSDGLLQQAIEDAYDALDAKDNGEEKKMGTTMTFVCFHAEGVTIAHIGDSRVYQLRPAKDNESARIVFHTRDHSLVNDLIKIGEITEEEAKTHPQKNVITRAMQPCQERRAKADITHLTDIQDGDYFYMCSDGMLEQTTDENLLFIVTKEKISNEQKVEMLREVTSDNKDNHTAHLIQVMKVEGNVASPVKESASVQNSSVPKGTYISPDEPESVEAVRGVFLKKVLIALIPIAILAVCAFFFLSPSSKDDNPTNGEDSNSEIVIDDEQNNQSSEQHEDMNSHSSDENINVNSTPDSSNDNNADTQDAKDSKNADGVSDDNGKPSSIKRILDKAKGNAKANVKEITVDVKTEEDKVKQK